MTNFRKGTLHPLVAAAAISVIVTSLAGVARLTGVWPAPVSFWETASADAASRIVIGLVPQHPQPSPGLPGNPADGTTAAGMPVPALVLPQKPSSRTTPYTTPSTVTSATPPTTPTTTPTTAPSVFFHVQSRALHDRMRMLERPLAMQGVRLAGIKIVGKGPELSDVRYFHEGEREEAAEIQGTLLALCLPVRRLKRISGFEPVAKPRQYEIWLAGDYRPDQ